ncbi:methyltransferase domain-containing protein [Nocardiopsis sp. JB363]|uniref:methyltransferase domain-containing protein n=1 Tax=Nocardiopsis sp. JB363 TaxID=1434837 RepID=UPI00097B3567|nr:methyltransferase domain-containing protein [Nocardiopsis sp. JB363]SIO90814.1 Protein-L-isoaspartate O-methyltransferase [Nocardiopsis sp. JB363]
MIDPHIERRAAMAAHLADRGVLTDPAWRQVVEKVPRHVFLPDTVWGLDVDAGDGKLAPVPRSHTNWSRWAYDDVSVITQVDDGTPVLPDGRGERATSSASQPSLVVAMLQALDVTVGMDVLEIGTATGYNCALLCEHLGPEHVTSIEIDQSLARQARANLAAAGYGPQLVVGDGTQGAPGRAPFDRVLATVAARDIPGAWISQTRPGGVIVTPWATGFATTNLLRLIVEEGDVAHGRVVGDAPFMWLRDQRVPAGDWRDFIDEQAAGSVEYRTTINPMPVCDADPSGGLALTVGALVPHLNTVRYHAADDSGEATIYLFDRRGSWALVEYVPGDEDGFEAHRFGPRDLCAEIDRAHRLWEAAGAPERSCLGVTVTTTGARRLWVDSPSNPVLKASGGARTGGARLHGVREVDRRAPSSASD